MADVQTLRNFVRAQLDVDDEELPDAILNVYLQEAFDRTLAADNRWPRNEFTWTLVKAAGDDAADLPIDLNPPTIMSVIPVGDDAYRLVNIDHEAAEDAFPPMWNSGDGGSPLYFSVWQQRLFLWPRTATDVAYSVTLRGYRQPVWSSVAGNIPDLDERLHIPLCYFAIALAYAAQEDEVLEGVYMARWERDVRNQLRTIMEPAHHRPLVLHGGAPIGGMPTYIVQLPSDGP